MPSFDIHLDKETSERAGAGGMFQIASLKDENGKGLENLVDQGKHYSSLEEVASDIADKLKINKDDVDLEEV